MSWRWHGLAGSSAQGLSHEATMQWQPGLGSRLRLRVLIHVFMVVGRIHFLAAYFSKYSRIFLDLRKGLSLPLKNRLLRSGPGKSQSQQIRYLNYICKNSFTFAMQCNLSKEWQPSNSYVPSTLKGTEIYTGHWQSSQVLPTTIVFLYRAITGKWEVEAKGKIHETIRNTIP